MEGGTGSMEDHVFPGHKLPSFSSPEDVCVAATPALSAGFCLYPPEGHCQGSMFISHMKANFATLKMKVEFGFTCADEIQS